MQVFDFAAYARFKWSDMRMILKAMGVTLHVTLLSLAIGTLIGLILGLIRCAKNPIVNKLPLIVMEPLRNSPLIVQLFLVFFGLPSVGIRMKAMQAAVLTLSLNTAAFLPCWCTAPSNPFPRRSGRRGMRWDSTSFRSIGRSSPDRPSAC